MEHAEVTRLLEREQIIELIRLERYLRDHSRYDELAECYTEDSLVRTTWFRGTGRAFAAASKEMAEQRGRQSRHLITPTHIRLNGDRALVDSYGEIHNRSVLEGVEVDTIQYCRFFSRVQRAGGRWLLASFDGIYGKDQIWPVNPADRLPFEWSELEDLRPSYRVWAYTLRLKGYEVGQEELGDDRPDLLAAFYAEADAWLAGGAAGSGAG
jgi:SnoaL-like domain